MSKTIAMIPYYGGRNGEHLMCTRQLEKLMPIVHIDACPYVDMARAFLVKLALKEAPDADVLVFIDHDILFKADDVAAMAERLRGSEYDMLGALYAYRGAASGLIGRIKNPPLQGTIPFFAPGIIEADYLGMGFTAIKRSTFETLMQDCPSVYCPVVRSEVWPFFIHSIWPGEGYHGEDLSFCRRMRARGLKIGIDTEPRILHLGQYAFGLEDAGIQVPRYQPLDMNFSEEKTQ